jgi:NADH dehydrogenase
MRGPLHAVTGAFSYSGRHITRALLDSGHAVRSLTGHPSRPDPFCGRVQVWPMDFDRPESLRSVLEGIDVLFNTYWVRFEHGGMTFDRAVRNSRTLITAAADAGVRRVVHLSVTNPDPQSELLYFRGKALVERAVIESGMEYVILRPALFFGGDDVLLNNIVWLIRRFPVFAVAGSGRYPVQPIHVDDLAWLAVELASGRDDVIADAVGPEIWPFEELVRMIGRAVRRRVAIIHVHADTVLSVACVLGRVMRDVVLTGDEIAALTAGLLCSQRAPNGTTRLSEWLKVNSAGLGRRYASELARHYR